MNANTRNAWWRIGFSLASACLLTLVVCVTLARLSPATAKGFPNRDSGEPPKALLNDTDAYTVYLPIVAKMCPYQSTRPPLQGTAHFAGEVKIVTPLNCTTGVPADSRLDAAGTYSGTPVTATVWVLAYSPERLYYPQSPDACKALSPTQVGGYWQVPVYLGKKDGPPEWFDVVAILTDEATNQFLGKWVKDGCEAGEYEGISAELLNLMAITEKDYIVVQTTD